MARFNLAWSLLAATASHGQYIGQGGDGNPHNWDRLRRCDHAQYSPKCGPCEGLGGYVTGDDDGKPFKNAPACKDVTPKGLDPKTVVPPKWGGEVTIKKSYEILIGRKRDPGCFEVFPENSSAGELCYKPQTGMIVEAVGSPVRAIYEEMNQRNLGKNVSAKIIHNGQNMWVVNDLLLGIHQCVCTQPKEGGVGDAVFPLAYNWTNNLMFVGQEEIEVEYGVGKLTLNHFAFGPHHTWSDLKTGNIVRAWQPFNGLQVFSPAEGITYTADTSVFPSIPPALCKKNGGATFRIKCDDDGHYKPNLEPMASVSDLRRAHTKVPRGAYRGSEHADMSSVLNRWINKTDVDSKDCAHWSVEELRDFIRLMHQLRHPSLNDVYTSTADKRTLKTDAEEQWKAWDAAHTAEGQSAVLDRVHRDGLCHEAVMLYVHHLTEEIRTTLGRKTKIPLLSHKRHSRESHPTTAAVEQTFKLYEEHVTCAACHSDYTPPYPSTESIVV